MRGRRDVEHLQHLADGEVKAGLHEIFAGDFEMDGSEEAHRSYMVALRGWIDGDGPVAPLASLVRPSMAIYTDDRDPVEVVLVVVDQVLDSG